MKLSFEVTRPEQGSEIIATASYVLVAVERHTFAKVSLPEKLIHSLKEYRG